MNYFIFFASLISFFLTFTSESFAARVVETAPMQVSSTEPKDSRAPNATPGAMIDVTLINLSNTTQSATVTLLDEKIVPHLSVGNPVNVVENIWKTDSPPNARWTHYMANIEGRERSQSVVLPGNSSKSMRFYVTCQMKKNAPRCFFDNTAERCKENAFNRVVNNDGSSCPPLAAGDRDVICYHQVRYQARFRVRIAEDRGAVLGNAHIVPEICGAHDSTDTEANLTFNGGRPF